MVGPNDPRKVVDLLAERSGLSKMKIKDAMIKGAVWLKRSNKKMKRLRRATAELQAGDQLELHYDEKLLLIDPPQATCISDQSRYSVWFKPAGLLAQGTLYGDHCSLTRQAELYFKPIREIFLVHRLDREASGLMLLAHSKDAAAKLSHLFQNNQVIKHYRVEILGNLAAEKNQGKITLPLDGKSAVTEYQATAFNPESNTSTVDVIIHTGRLHQIRRHFEAIGYPVMGDPKYGTGNKNIEGMQLQATGLRFRCPFSQQEMEFSI